MIMLIQFNELLREFNALEVTVRLLQLQSYIFNDRDSFLSNDNTLHFDRFNQLVPRMLSKF